MSAITEYEPFFRKARAVSPLAAALSSDRVNACLESLAAGLIPEIPTLMAANRLDLARMTAADPKYDRLRLDEDRIRSMAEDIRVVAALPSPLGRTLSARVMPNGLSIQQVSVPLGVVGMIYEARPNVTADAFSLCLKTGNAALLKGGSDAEYSNMAIMNVILQVLEGQGIDPLVAQLLPPARAATEALLQAIGWVDVVIPRGSQALIDFVRRHAQVPVIETGAGVVHTYVDETADLEKAALIILNAKTRRVSVCNALDCLLIHADQLAKLATLVHPLALQEVVILADDSALAALDGHYPPTLLKAATEADYGTEFLSLTLAVKTVHTLDDALSHIREHGSGHSEALLSEDPEHIERFVQQVDAAAVYVNTSTAFTDGAQFGLGAEIGISTQKLHARGPMGLDALTTYKWIVRGNGQIR